MAAKKTTTSSSASKKTQKSASNNKSKTTAKNTKAQAAKASKKAAKAGKANRKNEQLSMSFSEPKRYRRSVLSRMAPYISMVLAVILTVCLVTVGILEYDDGAGIVGYYIQQVLSGLFGGAAFLMPVLFLYLGLIWCLFHIRWRESDAQFDSPSYEDYRKARKKVVGNSWFSSVLLIVASAIIGVFANEYDYFDPVDMWEGAVDNFAEGGIIGSSVAYLFINAFEQLISLIILFTIAALFIILLCGITPDYIVTRIQYSRAIKKEEREAEREARYAEEYEAEQAAKALAARAEREKKLSKAAPAGEAPKVEKASTASTKPDMTVDELMAEYDRDMRPEPADAKAAEPEVYIGPSRDQNEAPKKAENTPEEKTAPETHVAGEAKDYDDETPFDAREYRGIDDILKNLVPEAEKPEAPAKAEPKEKTSAPLDMNEMGIDELQEDMAAVAPDEQAAAEPEEEPELPYIFPPYDLLEASKSNANEDYTQELQENAQKLVDTLKSFRVGVSEITYSRGPTITRYELKPNAGTRVRAIANLVDDIALNLAASGVRIEAPIPNKPAVGIEVPNRNRATVYLRDLIENPKFTEAKSKLTASLGMDVGGNPIYFDITKMPHMIIAGATGMGKSVCINGIIISILYKARPEDVKLILVDPKKVEFALYRDIPHLYAPIVSDPKKAAGALASAVAEMERRFELIEEVGVRDITTYNKVTENDPAKEHMPHMVIIIDELADLMMTAPDEVEASICRLAQKARAAGIHIIIGTQRPSVDVITGLIKANIPSRIACTVASQVDSRTIIDIAGAEKLIGRGDMLFAPVGAAKPMRVQGAFVSEKEVEDVVTFIKENNAKAKYNSDFINRLEEEAAKCGMGKKGAASAGGSIPDDVGGAEGGDAKFRDAVKLAVEEGKISTSLMQRRLGVGYGRAAKIIDTMEELGYVSKPDGNKPRRVLLTMEEYMRRVVDGTLEGGSAPESEE